VQIIRGFSSARSALTRQAPPGSFPISDSLKQRLIQLFGTRDPEQAVRQIIEQVREGGDKALLDLTLKIDGIKVASLEIDRKQVASARRKVEGELLSALELAAERIRQFHQKQRENLWHEIRGTDAGQIIRPLEKVGLYVPGGTAAYPSTVLMTAIPAKVAGVKEAIVVTPPRPDGTVSPATLAAADIAEVDRIFGIGGAQAIAALACGTESIPQVDKICGPGNIFVVLAKKLAYGMVGIDGLHGPSEVLIIADETADPEFCAADLLAQAEHDPLAAAVLVTPSAQLAEAVNRELEKQLAQLSRREIAAQSLEKGIMAVVASIDEALELANLYAPEHLCLMVNNASDLLGKVYNAGCVVAGNRATVVLGDYVAGPSHVLPTGGTARFSSPLSVLDFMKFINTVTVSDDTFKKLGQAATKIARAEGLDAHARAIEKRLPK
jgi:histidinol dehydrogenase